MKRNKGDYFCPSDPLSCFSREVKRKKENGTTEAEWIKLNITSGISSCGISRTHTPSAPLLVHRHLKPKQEPETGWLNVLNRVNSNQRQVSLGLKEMGSNSASPPTTETGGGLLGLMKAPVTLMNTNPQNYLLWVAQPKLFALCLLDVPISFWSRRIAC